MPEDHEESESLFLPGPSKSPSSMSVLDTPLAICGAAVPAPTTASNKLIPPSRQPVVLEAALGTCVRCAKAIGVAGWEPCDRGQFTACSGCRHSAKQSCFLAPRSLLPRLTGLLEAWEAKGATDAVRQRAKDFAAKVDAHNAHWRALSHQDVA